MTSHFKSHCPVPTLITHKIHRSGSATQQTFSTSCNCIQFCTRILAACLSGPDGPYIQRSLSVALMTATVMRRERAEAMASMKEKQLSDVRKSRKDTDDKLQVSW